MSYSKENDHGAKRKEKKNMPVNISLYLPISAVLGNEEIIL